MAVTDGSYVTASAVQGYLPSYEAGWSSNTNPSDTEVSQFIIEAEAVMNARLAAAGFTVPCTGAGSVALRLLGNIGARLVASMISKAATTGNSNAYGGEPSAYFQELEARALETFDLIVGNASRGVEPNPMILINGGVTSAYTSHAQTLISTYLLDNPSEDNGPDITLKTEF